MPMPMDVKCTTTLAEYYHEAVAAAMRNQGVSTTEMTEFYLVNLLSENCSTTLDNDRNVTAGNTRCRKRRQRIGHGVGMRAWPFVGGSGSGDKLMRHISHSS